MKRNKFSLSHFRMMSCTMGQLVPLAWYEVLPGDTIQQATSIFLRCAPLVSPPMHPVHVRVHHFFVPNRVLWVGANAIGSEASGGFENFITGGQNGLDTTIHPYIQHASYAGSTLADYLGLNTTVDPLTNVNALPFRAYQLIFNEFYRDRDLVPQVTVSIGDGLDNTTSLSVQNVAWQKDYITTLRSSATKGATISMFKAGAGANIVMQTGATATTHASYPGVPAQAANTVSTPPTLTFDATLDTSVANTRWFADLGSAEGAGFQGLDINDLRHQFAIQRFQEARLKYGTRYVEYLRYLGVRSSDARLQRPQYLGGGSSTVQFSEVLQTGVTTSGTSSGVGTMFGHGVSGQRSRRWRRFFEEHGIVMTLLSVRPITVYSQPIHRKWLRGMQALSGASAPAGMLGTREDYFYRELQHIGQQQVSALECDANQASAVTTILGFQDRYDEYRRHESQITGQFRSNLNTWHFARTFGALPTLNAAFVTCTPSVLPFADQAHDNLYIMANHSIQARRMMSREGQGFVA